jgi:predicted TPR repeat methyltransferase
MNQRTAIHDRVLNAADKDELAAAYAEWAEGYDHDLLDELGYVAPMTATRLLTSQLGERSARILDAGCGTGIVGALLHGQGYTQVDGFDYSHVMLAKAREKAAYAMLMQGDLMARLSIDDATYDAVISVGTFTCAHVGPQALNELVRITRPGGCICFTVRDQAWEEDDYRGAIETLVDSGDWKRLDEVEAPYIEKEGSDCRICVYQVAR